LITRSFASALIGPLKHVEEALPGLLKRLGPNVLERRHDIIPDGAAAAIPLAVLPNGGLSGGVFSANNEQPWCIRAISSESEKARSSYKLKP
jgi:hypothetical protein